MTSAQSWAERKRRRLSSRRFRRWSGHASQLHSCSSSSGRRSSSRLAAEGVRMNIRTHQTTGSQFCTMIMMMIMNMMKISLRRGTFRPLIQNHPATMKTINLKGAPQNSLTQLLIATSTPPTPVGSQGPREFCRQMGTPWAREPCEICDATVPHRAHLPHHMTDFNTYRNLTWWMSDTMEDGIDKPGQVNLTLDFRKSFDISYVRLRFYSSRPESFSIYKRTHLNSDWTPYQFYSATCNETYGIPDGSYVTRDNETLPLCTSEFSDLSPLTGGTVVFSTLEGRPGSYDFEKSKTSAIRITLDKMNTFGDEIFEDPLVLKSYFFAISDFSIGARMISVITIKQMPMLRACQRASSSQTRRRASFGWCVDERALQTWATTATAVFLFNQRP
ncbi:laminin-like protein lam-2 [Caerostris extrusa]|uniref:Laminin-like protein lam-2 n=1 Tax=Caerostris extrusa TaxID=172846 RepID=A0AAV4SCA9_CAEEX|nr:laminin-like protein lam-2 [Caerostris extrusa]